MRISGHLSTGSSDVCVCNLLVSHGTKARRKPNPEEQEPLYGTPSFGSTRQVVMLGRRLSVILSLVSAWPTAYITNINFGSTKLTDRDLFGMFSALGLTHVKIILRPCLGPHRAS